MNKKLILLLEEQADNSGFTFLPEKVEEIKRVVKNVTIQRELIELFNTLIKIDKTIKDPIAINRKNNHVVKIIRKLQPKENYILKQLKLKSFKDFEHLKVSFGNGSRGKTGSNSRGFSFEKEVLNDLQLYANGKSDFKHKALIEDLKKIVKPNEIKEIILAGSMNTKRPLKITNGNLLITSSDRSYNIGREVADIIIKKKSGDDLYFSLKFKSQASSAISFFNIGIKKYLKENEIKEFKIKDENGRAILNFFGIDEKRFCAIFNGFANKNIPIDPKYKKQEVVDSKADKSKIQMLLRSGIGQGYYVIYQIGNSYEVENIDKKYLDSITKIKAVKILYPEIGKSKYLQIRIDTTKYKFNIHIRNVLGGIYPTTMNCYYSGQSSKGK